MRNYRLIRYFCNIELRGNYLRKQVARNEIETSVRHRKYKDVGIDNVPSGIFKLNIHRWANGLREYYIYGVVKNQKGGGGAIFVFAKKAIRAL